MKRTRAYIEELLGKFLEGQTTEREEQALSEYFCESHDIPAEWQEYQALFRSFKTDAYDFSEEETDTLLGTGQRQATEGTRIWTLASAICATVAMVLLVWHPWKQAADDRLAPAPEIETARVTRVQESAESTTTAKARPEKVPDKPLLADTKSTVHKSSERNSHKHGEQEEAKAADTNASEMIEAILMLADVTPDEADLTASPANGSFAISTSDGCSFVLELSPGGSSIKQTSQQKHF